jgi:hypothetical protein
MEIVVPELPLNLLCVPDGRISVKVSVPSRPVVHAVLPAEKLIENLAIIERNLNIERRSRFMRHSHKVAYKSIVGTVTDTVMTEQTTAAVAVCALWCALNHPKERNEMRKALGSYLTNSKRGFVSFEAFSDGRVSIGVDQVPISDARMARAKDEADTMNQEGAAAAGKVIN